MAVAIRCRAAVAIGCRVALETVNVTLQTVPASMETGTTETGKTSRTTWVAETRRAAEARETRRTTKARGRTTDPRERRGTEALLT
jgi:hypothetical protein